MNQERKNLHTPLHIQEDRLAVIRNQHIARMRENGTFPKVMRAFIAEFQPVGKEALGAEQFGVGHQVQGKTEHITVVHDQFKHILIGTIATNDEGEELIEPNNKHGFNVVDVRSVMSMVRELQELKVSGELADLSEDLQRIEPTAATEDIKISTLTSDTAESAPSSERVTLSGIEVKSVLNIEDAIKLLSYQDVLPPEHKQDAIDAIQKGESTMAYAKELVYLYGQEGKEKVEELARGMVEDCLRVLKEKNVSPTLYAPSISWALWDIAKQSYLAKHPEESLPEYISDLASPFELTAKGDQKRSEIRRRHIGWEVMRAWDQDGIKPGSLPPDAEDILINGQRNDSGQLRSFELAKLGEVIRKS